MIAWYAGETWRLEAFRKGEDIYCASASKMFGVPVVKHGVNGHLRQKGKQAELACIAEGQLVLTNKGLIPIEKVTIQHQLWDGERFVKHDGVIYKGVKEVITYEGLTATKDHLVWSEGKSEPVQFEAAIKSKSHLLQTGNGRSTIRMGENHQSRKKVVSKMESLQSSYAMSRLWKDKVDGTKQFTKKNIKRLSKLFTTKNDTKCGWIEDYILQKQECENPKVKNYAHIWWRGINSTFPSIKSAGLWILKNVENVHKDLEMDRIDNNGNYEEGNIRFVPRIVNQANRRISVIPNFQQKEWPYTRGVITRMFSKGMKREEIIKQAEMAVALKRKNWKLIKQG